eukprot:TRINITY_DN189_c0_g1_i2.p2 TRINITY_DN189_c0_g1~~TRINITY_DN189_c0_g1_i2.p2  ORF type:complete len:111 (-),score=42.19 TRINITY_DN189_c0_g1_i2:84-416(-)
MRVLLVSIFVLCLFTPAACLLSAGVKEEAKVPGKEEAQAAADKDHTLAQKSDKESQDPEDDDAEVTDEELEQEKKWMEDAKTGGAADIDHTLAQKSDKESQDPDEEDDDA